MAALTLKGLHQVRRQRADGSHTWHFYAWRGGPKIGSGPSKLPGVLTLDHPVAQRFVEARKGPPPSDTLLGGQIDRYLASPAFLGLGASTQSDYLISAKHVRAKFADLPLDALADPAFRGILLDWRDERSSLPRAADKMVGLFSTLCAWLIERGRITVNPAEGVKHLYHSNRSDVIWTRDDLEKLRKFAKPQTMRAVELALLTGLSISDVIALPWSAVGAIAIDTHRIKTLRPVEIPIYAELAACLATQPKVATLVLTNSRKQPWTKDGLNTVFRRARDAAGLSRLHFHDLRGTAATRMVEAGLTKTEVAMIMGWDEKKVEQIARRYLSRASVMASVVARLDGKKNGG